MAIQRTIFCAVCKKGEQEKERDGGFKDWGKLDGIILNGEVNPTICPRHLAHVADYLDKLVQLNKGN